MLILKMVCNYIWWTQQLARPVSLVCHANCFIWQRRGLLALEFNTLWPISQSGALGTLSLCNDVKIGHSCLATNLSSYLRYTRPILAPTKPHKPIIQVAVNAQSKTPSLVEKLVAQIEQRGADKSEYMHEYIHPNSSLFTSCAYEVHELRV